MAEENTVTSAAAVDHSEPTTATKADQPSKATFEEGTDDQASEVYKTNGDVDDPSKTSSVPANEDTEMKDAAENTPATAPVPATGVANGTPASSKKATNGSAKKKSSGVPEHKTKKVNKRKSKSKLTHLDAQPGEHYFATMKGHPAWPAVICDEAMLPGSLLDSRPVTTRRADGSFRKPEYDDGGKRAHERTFPVMFLSTNEFAWMPNTDLNPLDPADCKDPETKGKSKLLLSAYAIAAEDYDLDHYKTMLSDHQAALDADIEFETEQATKKASKSKRKSVDASALAEDDEMDIDEEVATSKSKSKKRKKDAQEDDETEKPAKTPKTSTKLKLSTPKNPGTESSKKASKAKSSTTKKSKKIANSDDEAIDTPKPEEPKLTPAERKEKSQKLVLFYRHKLQRGFLSRDTAPREEEMKDMSDFLKELEGYPDLDGSIIRGTKIHKVLKAMLKLPAIPLDEEFHFVQRSHDLLKKWTDILAADPNDNQEEPSGAGEAGASTANGDASATKQAGESAAEPAVAPEEEKAENLKNKIGTTVEGEDGGSSKAEKTAEEKSTDAPAIDTAPAEEYKPPAVEADDEPST